MKLDDVPEKGRVVLAHESNEAEARLLADRELLHYILHPFCPEDKLFILDMDELFQGA